MRQRAMFMFHVEQVVWKLGQDGRCSTWNLIWATQNGAELNIRTAS